MSLHHSIVYTNISNHMHPTGGQVSGAILSEHQAEAEAATAPAEASRGGHDETKNGSDECQDEPWWYWWQCE